MKNIISSEWVEVAKVLQVDINSKLTCPKCGNDILEVRDVSAGENSKTVERYIHCPSCKVLVTLLMRGD